MTYSSGLAELSDLPTLTTSDFLEAQFLPLFCLRVGWSVPGGRGCNRPLALPLGSSRNSTWQPTDQMQKMRHWAMIPFPNLVPVATRTLRLSIATGFN